MSQLGLNRPQNVKEVAPKILVQSPCCQHFSQDRVPWYGFVNTVIDFRFAQEAGKVSTG
jgi:hypothetical protein